MALTIPLLVLSFCLSVCQVLAVPPTFRCKPLPGDIDWPSDSEWQALNSSVSGRLIKPVPPGAVCHPSWPQFDNATCELVATQEWASTSFHYRDPELSDYNDETCRPDPSAPCSDAGYPSYVVEAANVVDVQEAVKFAKNTGVRLIVKGTGHDFPGRSSGPASLSIYTRNLQGIEIVKKLKSSSPTTPAALVKACAGERNIDLLNFAAEHDFTIIGGADPHVGIGGLLLGGGHGPLTAKYGMAADQVVELEVVTADGEHLTINEDKYSDLFWAMRGAGGSTYAVILSATLKAYPSTPVTEYLFSYNTTSDTDSFWSLNAYFHSQLPRLSEASLTGYYFPLPLVTGVHNKSVQGQVSGQFLAPGLSAKEVKDIVEPMEEYLSSAGWADSGNVGGIRVEHPDFSKWWAQNEPQGAGYSGRLGSRLLDGKALTSDFEALKAALKTSTPVGWELLGHFTAGPGTHNPPNGISGGSNAVGLGWRKAYTHIVLPRIWTPLNTTQMQEITTDLRDIRVPALKAIAPTTGAYVNEIDPTEPEWKETMYGEHYSRLLEVKLKYDPSGVFWCKHCVASDLWRAIGPYGIENGVGQNQVRLCR